MDLGISQVGLSAMDVQRLKAVMSMAITNGALKNRWQMVEPDRAHLIVLAPDNSEGLAMMAANQEKKTKFFAVLVGESDDVTLDCAKLHWPIRLENVLALLKTVERKVTHIDRAKSSPVTPVSGSHLLRLASLLRESEESSDRVAWRVVGIHRRTLYIAPGQRVFYFGDSLATLRQLDPDIRLEFVPLPVEELPDKQGGKPIVMLQWLVGLLSGSQGLVPWLKPESTFRLRRFPDFQMLYHDPAHRRIAATLTRPYAGAAAIAELTGANPQTVTGFINAASLCGYLTVVDAKAPISLRPRRGASARRNLFQSFRKALGIATADA